MATDASLTRQQSRLVDRIAVERYGIPGIVLMENAGRGVVDVLMAVDPTLADTGGVYPAVVILCGKGNNAGDGFVVARHLEIRGAHATVVLLAAPAELTGDARTNYEILSRAGAAMVDVSAAIPAALNALLDQYAAGATWLVDAMLGTGASGAPREPLRSAIAWMNAQSARRLAIDVPSGLDCDTGTAAGEAVRADVTCTFVAVKTGFAAPSARPFLGEVHALSIGTPAGVLAEAAAS